MASSAQQEHGSCACIIVSAHQHHHHVEVGELGGVAGGFHHGLHVKEDGGDEQPGGDGVTRIQILDGVQRIPALPINMLRVTNS